MNMQMHRRGPGECSLNVSVTSRLHDASCRDVVPTFKSAGQRKMEERNRERVNGSEDQKDGYRKFERTDELKSRMTNKLKR